MVGALAKTTGSSVCCCCFFNVVFFFLFAFSLFIPSAGPLLYCGVFIKRSFNV